MKFLPFVLRHLAATPVRTASTVVSMGLCVFMFCLLQSILVHFDAFIANRSPKRLITRHQRSIMSTLPLTHGPRIQAVPGVKRVAATLLFGGVLPARREGKTDGGSVSETDWTAVFQNAAIEAEPYFAMSPELSVAPAEFKDFLGDLRGCVVGRDLARKFGWKIGDRFFLRSFVSGLRKKSGPFEFVIRGFMDTDLAKYPGTDPNMMFFHLRYLMESLPGMNDASVFTVEIEDPSRAGEIAAAIDAQFENSSAETFTESERAFLAGFISMVGDLSVVINGIGLAVCFTILLVTANTMSMAVRERRREIAVLKTVGFGSGQVMFLILAEALCLGLTGGALGVLGTLGTITAINNASGHTLLGISHLVFQPFVAFAGVAVALGLGLAAGFFPAWGAYRARVTEMLRSN